ncbi:MAG: nuclear transport factor 2 family protein [Gemmatimonadota bacterium]|nr:nuclear transport factor 2 family protein [Gemmatimonadota bacterium]
MIRLLCPRSFTVLLASMITAAVASAQSSSGNRDEALTEVSALAALKDTLVGLEKQSWVAWKARDPKFFQQFLADDHVELLSSGPIGKAAAVGYIGKPICVVSSYGYDNFSTTRFSADAALLTYRAEQSTLCGGHLVPSPVWVGSLYILRGGRWQNAAFQETVAPRK